VVLYRDEKMHKNKNTQLIANLVSVDMLLGLTNAPIFLANAAYDGWFSGDFVCNSMGFTSVFFCFESILLITTIAFERYMALNSVRGEFPYAIHCMVGSCLLSLLCASLPLPLIGINQYALQSSRIFCTGKFWTSDKVGIVHGLLCSSIMSLALILMVYFYACILRRIQTSHQRIDRELRLTKQMLVLVCWFYIVWVPANISLGYSLVFHEQISPLLDSITVVLIYSHSVINPALYAYLNPRLRTQLWNVLSCGQFQPDEISRTEFPIQARPRLESVSSG